MVNITGSNPVLGIFKTKGFAMFILEVNLKGAKPRVVLASEKKSFDRWAESVGLTPHIESINTFRGSIPYSDADGHIQGNRCLNACGRNVQLKDWGLGA